ncbi:hypothetical protein KY325_02280 [Candidatus Woesearchaeota archaeon]|nr:hypothetical protein [Candidatus Woesearchaeota archaeon]
MKKTIWVLMALIVVSIASAHQPRISFGVGSSLDNPILVEEPEISKAYYGELNGAPDYYVIDSAVGFNLYLNILVPDLDDSRTDFVVDVSSNGNNVVTLDGKATEWTEFYEEFARDDYLWGPEVEMQVEAGKYLIVVSNPDNVGKYSLAVGNVESFPFNEIINTFKQLPTIKKEFFGKPKISAFINIFTLIALVPVLLVIGLALVIVYLVKRKKKKK